MLSHPTWCQGALTCIPPTHAIRPSRIVTAVVLANENRGMSILHVNWGGRGLNTCTWCPLRTSSSLRRVCRAKIESNPLSTSSWVYPPHSRKNESDNSYNETMKPKTSGKRRNIDVQIATTVVREALVIFNIYYPPEGIQKAHESKVQDRFFTFNSTIRLITSFVSF